MRTCPWFIRWWHERQRNIDRKTIWKTLMRETRDGTHLFAAWELFKTLPGQDHWRCACSPKGRINAHVHQSYYS